MKKKLTYIFSLATALLALGLALMQGCTRIDPAERIDPADAITFAPTISNTKALLDAADLNSAGTMIQVYDNLTGFSGKIGNTTIDPSQTIEYFSNEITYDAGNTTYWPYCNPATSYPWTRNGTHMFHGWLTQDSEGHTAASFFSNGFSYVNRVLTIGTKKLTIDSDQFDFSYSDVTSIDASTREPGNNTVVPLHLKHLFGAIGITIKNISEEDVKVYSVRLRNFPNQAGATLTYTLGSTTSVDTVFNNLQSSGVGDYWPNKITSPIILRNINHAEGNKIYDAYTGTALADGADPSYRLSWPMTYAALKPKILSVDEDGIPTYAETSPAIEVTYGPTNTNTGTTFKYSFPQVEDLTTSAITSGKKYRLDLSFADKQVVVSFNVLPWDWEEYPMAYEGDAISTTQLKFTTDTYTSQPKVTTDDGVKHDVIQLKGNSTAGSYIAKGTFKAYTPVNGVLSVTMSGNTEDFIVSLDSGHVPTGTGSGNTSIAIDPHRDGGQITLTVRPNGSPASGSRMFLHFSVRNNGRDADADTEINRDNWMVTIP